MANWRQRFIEVMKKKGYTASLEYAGKSQRRPRGASLWKVTAVRNSDGKRFSVSPYLSKHCIYAEWHDFEVGFEIHLIADDSSEDVKENIIL